MWHFSLHPHPAPPPSLLLCLVKLCEGGLRPFQSFLKKLRARAGRPKRTISARRRLQLHLVAYSRSGGLCCCRDRDLRRGWGWGSCRCSRGSARDEAVVRDTPCEGVAEILLLHASEVGLVFANGVLRGGRNRCGFWKRGGRSWRCRIRKGGIERCAPRDDNWVGA